MTGQAAIDEEAQAGSTARSSSFYAAMRIMPPSQREAMYEIYHYCRSIDDIADDEGEFEWRLGQLGEWRRNIALLYEENPPAKLRGLARAAKDFGLRRQDFLAVIDGMEMDVRGPIVAPDSATLALYCDRVACAVGRLSVRVFGMQEQGGLDLSHHLGMALQLTNILRDLDEDAATHRLYLPMDLLAAAGISDTRPAEALAHPAIASVCDALAAKALAHFSKADAIMKQCERRRVRTPRVMSQAYHAILTALMERGFAFRPPVRLSKMKLGYILVRNLFF